VGWQSVSEHGKTRENSGKRVNLIDNIGSKGGKPHSKCSGSVYAYGFNGGKKGGSCKGQSSTSTKTGARKGEQGAAACRQDSSPALKGHAINYGVPGGRLASRRLNQFRERPGENRGKNLKTGGKVLAGKIRTKPATKTNEGGTIKGGGTP